MFDIFEEFEKGNKPLEIPIEKGNKPLEIPIEEHEEQEQLANNIYSCILEKMEMLETKFNDFISSQDKEKEINENDN